MYISLKDSRAKGFRNWADTHHPDDGKGGRDDGSAAVVIPAPDDAVLTHPERPHRPWLVPGAGRL
jgi:hypothetical protein